LPNTQYYVRAFATNSAGTGYGNQVTFTTEQIQQAAVTTTDVTLITSSTAVSGGDVTSDGGEAVTERGVCWSTAQNPTTADSKTSDGSGTGIFISNLADLTSNTTYYLRAYATNSAGTVYGNEVSFTTPPGPNEVLIQNYAFSPATITVAANTIITWTNKDGVGHTVTSDTGVFESGTINTNGTYSYTFTTPGTYPYHCTPHPYMTATVIVN
jgi:plastocyanin